MREATVFVRLLDESVDVWRPVPAVDLGDRRYQLLTVDGYDPADEAWEFVPGAIVECLPREIDDEVVLVATKRA